MKWTNILQRIEGGQGSFEVSTVQTFAGGASDRHSLGEPFSLSDYANETPWPFETMVFKIGSSTGLFHEPHHSAQRARDRHAEVVSNCREGTLQIGYGVKGDFGVPSMTPEDWQAQAQSG